MPHRNQVTSPITLNGFINSAIQNLSRARDVDVRMLHPQSEDHMAYLVAETL